MEKEIIFRIHLQHVFTGKIIFKEFTYGEIFSGNAIRILKNIYFKYYVIGKSEFTGRYDSKGNRIYENDIIDFDEKEWGSNSHFHIVTWDNKESKWCFGGGTASDMHYRTVIGNKFDNPELWNSLIH
ncbi:MAG TPA: YopX family protein [archaeon]|jgi:hypothetical protein|nr:YopX family protein [archaeon]